MGRVNQQIYIVTIILMALSNTAIAQNFSVIDEKAAQVKNASVDPKAEPMAESKEETKVVGQEVTDNKKTEIKNTYESAKAYAAKPESSRYTLGAEDIVEVIVARHPEVSGKYTINTEGKIQYEFVGDVKLLGITKEEAVDVISKKLATYIVNPEVTVKILEYNSKVVYVVGEVGAPGKIYMRGDTITVRDALLAARLPQLTASTDNATLFTPAADGKVVEKKVNVYNLLYKGDLRENYVMNPGDTLYLPATLWAKVARFINPVAQPVGAAAGTGRVMTTGF